MAEWPKGIPQPLDLIFTWGRSSKAENLVDLVVEEAIEGVTGGPSHVRLYLGQGCLWEFTLPECRYGTLDEIDFGKFDIEVGYHIMAVDLAVERVLIIHEEAERLIGTKYDTAELFDHLLDEIGLDHRQDSDPEKFVCSTGVEHLFRLAGISFRPDEAPQLVSPQDIRESRFYRVRWRSWGNGDDRKNSRTG